MGEPPASDHGARSPAAAEPSDPSASPGQLPGEHAQESNQGPRANDKPEAVDAVISFWGGQGTDRAGRPSRSEQYFQRAVLDFAPTGSTPPPPSVASAKRHRIHVFP